jgi:hypothetical protein
MISQPVLDRSTTSRKWTVFFWPIVWFVCYPLVAVCLEIYIGPIDAILFYLLASVITLRIMSAPSFLRCQSRLLYTVIVGWIILVVILLTYLPEMVDMWRHATWRQQAAPLSELGALVSKKYGEWCIDAANETCSDETFRSWMPKLKELGVQNLGLEGTQITNVSMKQLGQLVSLHTLSLTGTKISDVGLEQLKGLDNLEVLVLSRTQITNDGLAALRAMPHLRRLYLCGTQISDAGLQHLHMLKLEYLDLMGTQVSREMSDNYSHAHPGVFVVGPRDLAGDWETREQH